VKNNFKPINNALANILKKYNLNDTYALEYLKKNWSAIDKTISIHSSPVAYKSEKKELKMKVKNPQWKNEFIKNKNALIQKLTKTFTQIEIKEIEFL